jgi:hypothetical protein
VYIRQLEDEIKYASGGVKRLYPFRFGGGKMTDEEWETSLKSMNEKAKKWVDEEIDKIKYNVVKELIQKETQND